MPHSGPLLSNPSLFSQPLRQRINKLRSEIVKTNYNTQYVQTALELSEFRHATTGLIDRMDDDTLSEIFRKTVHFTAYDSYAPLIARLFEKPCKASAVVDLLAPGLPDYTGESSSTSGGVPKTFPKYNYLSKIRSLDVGPCAMSNVLLRRTTAFVCYVGLAPMDVVDEDNCSVATIYETSGTVVGLRTPLYLDPEKDKEKMGTFIFHHTAPYATGFIKNWQSLLLINALFAVGNRSLETMFMIFINTFVDMMRHLDMQFDIVVDCIENGTIPDLDGIAEVRHHLESNMVANPERAAELRRLGRPSSRPGWCGHVWPNFDTITAIASGSFASSIPLARQYLNPKTAIHPLCYGSSEGMIGLPYNPLELNQFKMVDQDIIEFLDISKNDSISALAQPWEVEQGKRYEPVMTTRDGLWRYRFGDVVEISGFDPTDGIPVMQFIERRNVALRFVDMIVTEKELRAGISCVAPNMVVNWTVAIDDRRFPYTIGFFVELTSDQDSDLSHAPDRVLDKLSRLNGNVGYSFAHNTFRKPTIRLLRSGTFSEFVQLKLDEGSGSYGQIKVPVVLPKAEYVTWFLNRVVQEL